MWKEKVVVRNMGNKKMVGPHGVPIEVKKVLEFRYKMTDKVSFMRSNLG